MNQELLEGNTGPFSSVLMECLAENLRLRRQSILLLNRRGYHTFVSCRAWGEPVTCPHCSISLTYHAANRRLMCHYCGYSIPFPQKAPTPPAPGALCRGGNPESGGGRRGAVPGGENPADGRGHHYGEIFPREEAETIRGWGNMISWWEPKWWRRDWIFPM